MVHSFFGNDTVQVRERAFAFLRTLTEDDTLVTRVTPETFAPGLIEDAVGGSSLFGAVQVTVLDTLSEGDVELLEDVLEELEAMRDSKNQFILIEGALSAPLQKKVEARSTSATEISVKAGEKFSTFSMADALLRRDKKSLWLLLVEARERGVSNEEIAGILFWQLKVLRLAGKTKSPEEAGQKPFPYQKAKRALGNFKEGETEKLSGELLSIYHDGHLGKVDLSTALERWILTV